MLNAVVAQKAPGVSFSSCGSSHQDASLPQFYAISLKVGKKLEEVEHFLQIKEEILCFLFAGRNTPIILSLL